MEIKHIDRPFEVKDIDETGNFTGYLSVFGNIDSGGDVIASGAFAETIKSWKSRGSMPPVLWQHRTGEPLGPFLDMREDDHGLWVKGHLLVDDIPRAKEARALLKSGAIKGMSIGYVTRDESMDRVTGVRTLKQVELYEGSIVTFPMNGLATVSAIKSRVDTIETLSDAERLLRDAAGLSKSEATAFVSRIKTAAARNAMEDEEMAGLVALKNLLCARSDSETVNAMNHLAAQFKQL